MSVWQHVQLSEQICPWDTLACCWDVKRPTNNFGVAGVMEADDSRVTTVFHSPTVIPPSALDKLSITKRYHRRRTCSHTSPRRWPTMVTLHDTQFVECRWWNDAWTVKNCRHLTVVGLHDTGPGPAWTYIRSYTEGRSLQLIALGSPYRLAGR